MFIPKEVVFPKNGNISKKSSSISKRSITIPINNIIYKRRSEAVILLKPILKVIFVVALSSRTIFLDSVVEAVETAIALRVAAISERYIIIVESFSVRYKPPIPLVLGSLNNCERS